MNLPEPEPSRRYTPRLARGFARWLRRYFARNFDAVRVDRDGRPPAVDGGPLLIYTNHPSWWDPIHFILLASLLFPERRIFGPFEAEALKKYRILERFGAFGIDLSTPRGGATFLRTSRALLALPDAMLVVTAQGQFCDPRTRPVQLQPGVAHLVRRLEHGLVVPLAVEYPFWNERRPEALSHFGRPFRIEDEPQRSTEAWNDALATRLEESLDALAASVEARDPERFDTLVQGRSGVGGVYDLGRRVRAAMRGERFDASHGGERR